MAASKKSAQKSSKSAQQATTGAKVAKVAGKRASAQAPAKPAKPAKKSGQQAAPRRSQFAGMSIKSLVPKGETPCRGGAAVRFDAIVSHKKVDDAIGSTYRIDGESEDRKITSADIAYLVERELISVA
jgi:hypothetical protein